MLIALSIENFAIVKRLDLDFADGMTVFTGETGAGKSIMLDALLLALGARSEASMVRFGEEKCDISATFHIEAHSEPALWLSEQDILVEEGEVILRRVIYAEGRHKASINGQAFPLQKIKELADLLVHIHGQHQQQSLMQHQTHREQLDRFAAHEDLQALVRQCYKDCVKTQKAIDELMAGQQQSDKAALLQFQIEELRALNMQEGELASLYQEHQLLHHAKDYLSLAAEIKALLDGEESANINQGLHHILQRINELPKTHPGIQNSWELINSAAIQCHEALAEINAFSNAIQLDPERLTIVEERMSELYARARKYHIDPKELISFLKGLEQELSELEGAKEALIALKKQQEASLAAFEKAALALRTSREAAAVKLAEEITQHIQKLGMPKGYVELVFTALEKIQPHGLDKVEYLVCTNPGMLPDTLNKIASGGELSRISLAIEMVTAQKGTTPTLLFDEVDVGIGGAEAALVGRLLRSLGARLQVFCVTHQPQVASSAHHHYRVEKLSDEHQTFSKVSLLANEEKVDELARMLGGLTITSQTRTHAKELIEQSM